MPTESSHPSSVPPTKRADPERSEPRGRPDDRIEREKPISEPAMDTTEPARESFPPAHDPPEQPVNRTEQASEAPFRLRRPTPAPSKTRAWLILPMGIAGVIVAAIVASLFKPQPTSTVTEVTRQVHEIILRTSDRPGIDDGGSIGPMWIAAREADVLTGALTDVRVRAGQVRLAARKGRLIVDADANAISFTLDHVVLVSIPETNAGEASSQSIVELDSFVLGPVPYKHRIVADGHPAGKRSATQQLADVRPE